MPNNRQGAIHLFQIAGIDVFLHWSWFVVAIIEIGYLKNRQYRRFCGARLSNPGAVPRIALAA